MKKSLYLLLSILAIVLVTISCGKEKDAACQDITCTNRGTCEKGTCKCPDGYEGQYCERLSAEKFVGLYEGKVVYTDGITDHRNVRVIINKTAKDNVIYLSEQVDNSDSYKEIVCEIYDKTKLKVVAEKVYNSQWAFSDISVDGGGEIDELGLNVVLYINMIRKIIDHSDNTTREVPYKATITLKRM